MPLFVIYVDGGFGELIEAHRR